MTSALPRRPLGSTGIEVSALGLGTVKLGRDQGLKYPAPFTIPDDAAAARLLDTAADVGINLLDTAPAYGRAEARLGQLLKGQRDRWVIVSKTGEQFAAGRSRFDFSPEATREGVEASLRALDTDWLDCVLVHSDGNDLDIIRRLGTLDALRDLQRAGAIRSYGMSTKTLAGGLAAVAACDVVMVTLNRDAVEELPVILAAHRRGRGVLVKKPLGSGHLGDTAAQQLQWVLARPGVSAAVVGTIDPLHLAANAAALREA